MTLRRPIIRKYETIRGCYNSVGYNRLEKPSVCEDCDKVFFCSTYLNKHNNGIVHKNKVIANQTINQIIN